MILNKAEFLLMNNPLRTLIQERYEMATFCKMSPMKKWDAVLEIGCGSGNGTRLIKKYYRPRKITAIDLDEKMIELAIKKSTDRSVDFMVMNAAQLAFAEKSFDAVFDFGIMHHIPNWRDCICELARVLKNHGQLILEELAIESFSGVPGILWKKMLAHPYEAMYTFQELEQFLEETGFRIINRKIANPLGLLKHIFINATADSAPRRS